jgi:hypothetical protein
MDQKHISSCSKLLHFTSFSGVEYVVGELSFEMAEDIN